MRYSFIAIPLVLLQIVVLVIEMSGIYPPINQPIGSFALFFITMVCVFLTGVNVGMVGNIEP